MQATRFTTSIHAYAVMVALLCFGSAAAQQAPSAGTLLMQSAAGNPVPATLLNTDVNVIVNGLVARVSVMQHFENTSSDWVEGLYVFPLPDRAAVDHMRLIVGDRLIEGEIREKAEARREYEQAKQAGKKTSLVEQQKANLFTTSVANIAPGETVIVEIEYLEDVRYDAGVFSLRFPMTLTPRYAPGEADAAVAATMSGPPAPKFEATMISAPLTPVSVAHKVSLHASINAGMPLAVVTSRYHPVHVGETGGRYSVSLAGGLATMDRDFELSWQPVASAAPRAMIFAEVVGGEPHYLLMVVPPDMGSMAPATLPREQIFIIDTSGSMHGSSLAQAKQALERALDGLRPGDHFNIIEFNSFTRPLFGSSMPADTVSISTARDFIRSLQSGGGTRMHPALAWSLTAPPPSSHLKQVIFITDGAVDNEEALFRLIETRLGQTRLFTVGIGSAPNSWFMRKAAEVGRGSFTMIGSLDEVGEKMERLFRKLEQPQVTDIAVEWPGGSVVEAYPAVVPDLYAGEPVAVRASLAGGVFPGATVRVAGNSMAGSWQADVSLDPGRGSPGVGALWARARIAALLDSARRGADKDAVRADVVATALEHHLVSRYTSLVAVDKTPARVAGEALRKDRVPGLVAKGQTHGMTSAFPATATNAAALMRSGALTIAVALVLGGIWAGMGRIRVRAA